MLYTLLHLNYSRLIITIVYDSNCTFKISLFTDAATSSNANLAIGAFVYLTQSSFNELNQISASNLLETITNHIYYNKYHTNKSTWAEIRTAIDALYLIYKNHPHVTNIDIYTDCQNFCDLISRRKDKLIKANFITKAGKTLEHAELYKELFLLTEKFKIKTIKIRGHAKQSERLTIEEKIFSILDSLSRNKLRAQLL